MNNDQGSRTRHPFNPRAQQSRVIRKAVMEAELEMLVLLKSNTKERVEKVGLYISYTVKAESVSWKPWCASQLSYLRLGLASSG